MVVFSSPLNGTALLKGLHQYFVVIAPTSLRTQLLGLKCFFLFLLQVGLASRLACGGFYPFSGPFVGMPSSFLRLLVRLETFGLNFLLPLTGPPLFCCLVLAEECFRGQGAGNTQYIAICYPIIPVGALVSPGPPRADPECRRQPP